MTVLAGADFDGREMSIERALFKRSNGQQSKRRGTFATNYLFQIPANSAQQGCYARRYATNYLLTTSTIQLRKVKVKGVKRFFGHPTTLALNGTPLRSRPLLVQAKNNRVCQNAAFTLAEVLITLGIIGIVAAMTIPTLISKYRHKVLEMSFKKTYANLQNAFRAVIADDYPVYVLNPTDSRPDGDPNFDSEFGRELRLKYRAQTKIDGRQKAAYEKSIKNYTRTKQAGIPQCSQFLSSASAFMAADGSVLSVAQNCGALWVTVDTNGIFNGPNAMGHDIFLFYAPNGTSTLVPATTESEGTYDEDGNFHYNNTEENKNKCSKNAKSAVNGITCAQYAVVNKCPDGTAETYWECLP